MDNLKTTKMATSKSESISKNEHRIKIDLFEPGMGLFHRAGLAGLISTLQWIWGKGTNGKNNVSEDKRPQGSWYIEKDRQLILEWENTTVFLKRLYELSFQQREGLFYMPGKFPYRMPPLEVQAAMHKAITSTFYTHKPSTVGKSKGTKVRELQIDDQNVTLTYDEWSKFIHAEEYKVLIDKKNDILTSSPISYKGGILPGAMERHAAHAGKTDACGEARFVLCLHFAMVACLTLPGRNAGSGIIVVPEINSLANVQLVLANFLPQNITACYVGGAGEASYQAELRLSLADKSDACDIPACIAMTITKKPWKAFCRNNIVRVDAEARGLKLYEQILNAMPTRQIQRKNVKKSESSHFWFPGISRPFFAENLARNRPFYDKYYCLFTSIESTAKTLYERKDLQTMIEKIQFQDAAERSFVTAVHEAMRHRFGAIASENSDNPVTLKNRIARESERLRLALAGAKTQTDFRYTITEFWSRGGNIPVLRDKWTEIIPFLSAKHWQHGRDLALLALASYKGHRVEEEAIIPVDNETLKNEEQSS